MNLGLEGTLTTTGGEVTTAFIPKCSHCKHAAVCRYKKDYKKLLSSIEETYNEYKNSDIFKINLDCEYYMSDLYTITSVSGEAINIKSEGITLNPCGIEYHGEVPKVTLDSCVDHDFITHTGNIKATCGITDEDLKKIR